MYGDMSIVAKGEKVGGGLGITDSVNDLWTRIKASTVSLYLGSKQPSFQKPIVLCVSSL